MAAKGETEAELRNWAELPTDALSVILAKLGAIDILRSAEAVCRPWRQLSLQPHIWRCISITCCSKEEAIPIEELARKAIDRSAGHIVEFSARHCGSDQLLAYIADRTTELKYFTMIFPRCITGKGLANFIARCPVLEKCEVLGSVKELARGSIGRPCPEMKVFCLVWQGKGRSWWGDEIDAQAMEIAGTMPQLRMLKLFDNLVTNKGLHAILDNCIHLEYLDIRCCRLIKVDVDSSLRAKLAKIKTVKLLYEDPDAENKEEEEEEEEEGDK